MHGNNALQHSYLVLRAPYTHNDTCRQPIINTRNNEVREVEGVRVACQMLLIEVGF
jgi:hypothetical protein